MIIMDIPDKYKDLLLGKNFANVATINPDGSPQVTPMWIDFDEGTNEVLVNTAKGRKKARNMTIGSKVALTVLDSTNSYRYLAIQGEILDVTTEGAEDHIHKLAMKYFGREKYTLGEGEVRLLVKIKLNYVHASG